MGTFKKTLFYKLLRETKNLFLQIWRAIYWQYVRIVTLCHDHFEDKRLAIETDECVCGKDMSLYRDMVSYVPIPYKDIRRILDHLDMGPDDVFVDFGCGKGRAVFAAASMKIKKAIGVEIDKRLLEIFRKNLASAKYLKSPVEIRESDAAISNVDDGSVFFFYNPFGYKTMIKVMDNIRASLDKNPRRMRFVYYCPEFRHLFDNAAWLKPMGEIAGTSAIVWESSLR